MNYLGLEKKYSQEITDKLYVLLSDIYVIMLNSKNNHWNVKGNDFFQVHKFFEEFYNDLDWLADEVAERIKTLDFDVDGRMSSFVKHSKIEEKNSPESSEEMLNNALSEIIYLISESRKLIEIASEKWDIATESILSDLVTSFEKKAWMIKTTLS